jgi:hypothetical protein
MLQAFALARGKAAILALMAIFRERDSMTQTRRRNFRKADIQVRPTWPGVTPLLLPGLLFGARVDFPGQLYAGEEIEIARRT